MGRGKLTKEEVEILRKNPYVKDVNENRVMYTEEFKLRFINEYFSGKTPTAIFVEAGFDVRILGSKRIERASARWREANASGNLAQRKPNNNFYYKNANGYTVINERIKKQEAEINQLKERLTRLESLLEQEK